jgi:hypothetical protein
MDTSDYPSLGRLAMFSAQLSAQNQRAAAVVDGQLDEVERLFRAAAAGDWQSLLNLSEQLVVQLTDAADQPLVRKARKASEALRRNPVGRTTTRHINELLNVCREVKLRRQRRDGI